ncbi:HNH endonuclease signature motif containing protein [Branchiibius sp. NY16-3462-2]|uniref:HNH endonuclease signature motif containing protein n=1 Tax=Branchiibius sp. NY16-3462-2 TaxID=1807500 RepID=UPI000793F867|nr:HNH endonuclease signature motif containing protein [Branchiibius sp. NY16-3462-2]KYH44225.1 hypothetical protein AZH51_06665 [Branchiibius sp. NY16-3462-2]
MSATPSESPSGIVAAVPDAVLTGASVAELLAAAEQLLRVAYDRVGSGAAALSQDALLSDVTAAQRVQNSAWGVQTHRIAQAAAIEHREDPNPVEGALPRLISRVVVHEPGSFVDEWFPLEVATRLGWSDRQAGNRISDAVTTLGRCPRLLDRVGAGGLDPFKATVVAEVTHGAPEHVTVAVEDRVLAGDPETTTAAKLRAKARRLRVRLDPIGADAAAAARRRSAVGVFVREHHEPGLSELTAVLPTLDAAKLMAAIDQLARDLHSVTTTDKTLAECRVDALTDLTLAGVGVDTQLTFLIPIDTAAPAGVDPAAAAASGDSAGTGGDDPFAGDLGEDLFDGLDFDEASLLAHEALIEQDLRDQGLVPINGRDLMDEELRALFDAELAELNAIASGSTEHQQHDSPPESPGASPPGCEHVPDPDNTSCGHLTRYRTTPTLTDTITTESRAISDLLLPRVGVIPVDSIVEMTHLLGVKLSRALTDAATGVVVETGDRSYRPGARLARFVQARDQHCRFPGCTRPAKLSDIDHVIRYPDGETAAHNLQCLCRHHHRAKHEGGWKVIMSPTGVCTWTSPTGRTYLTTPGD